MSSLFLEISRVRNRPEPKLDNVDCNGEIGKENLIEAVFSWAQESRQCIDGCNAENRIDGSGRQDDGGISGHLPGNAHRDLFVSMEGLPS